jgi:hypothetical protein
MEGWFDTEPVHARGGGEQDDEGFFEGRNMSELAITFIDTRSRKSDPQTSRDAAKHATSNKASQERRAIFCALEQFRPGLTAREIAAHTGIDFYAVSRRISEVAGIHRTDDRRDGCAVWVYS